MTDDQHAERIARIRAERAAIGRGPFIESLAVYLVLDAILSANDKKSKP